MIKCEVIEDFSLLKFDELKNIKRANEKRNEKGKLYKEDTFECSQEMVKYLTGANPLNKVVVKIIEYAPEKDTSIKEEKREIEKEAHEIVEKAEEKSSLTKKGKKSKN